MDELPPSDRKNLEWLIDSFGTMVSLGQIVSVYCQSGRNPDGAHQMLCGMQRRASKSSSSTSDEDNISAGYPSDFPREKAHTVQKPKKHPASVETVSAVIGRDYAKQRPSTNGCWRPKPIKLNSDDIPVSKLEDGRDNSRASVTMHHEIEDFLFKMLGDGFNLEMSTIQDILGQCGYDMQQSMERLLNLPAPTMEKNDDLLEANSEEVFSGNSPPSLPIHTKGKFQNTRKRDLEKEVLVALFTASERSKLDSEKIRSGKEARRARPVGGVVKEPMKETIIDYRPIISRKQVIEKSDEKNKDDYDILRKAVAEYQTTMKEYYTAAAVAFANQDYERAQKLQEEGHFFLKKAREADDKSAEKLIERNDEEDMVIDVHEFEPETVPRFLKVQLAKLSGISSLKHLKVIIGSIDGNAKDVSRKRRVLKFLEKEKVKWTEEGNGWTVVIPLREIDPTKLSFAKK